MDFRGGADCGWEGFQIPIEPASLVPKTAPAKLAKEAETKAQTALGHRCFLNHPHRSGYQLTLHVGKVPIAHLREHRAWLYVTWWQCPVNLEHGEELR